MPKKIDISGQQFGEWMALERIGGSMWLCRCSCGTESMVMSNMLKLGKSTKCKSCASKKHNKEGTKIYNVWAGMKQRCQNPKFHGYARYGGRGIKVCDEWQSFEGFYADMGDPPKNKSVGRIDNDGNYCKENCRWETPKQQMRNRSTTRFYEYQGRKVALGVLAEEKGMPVKRLRERMDVFGMTLEDAMLKPYKPRSKKN